ncbi:MAG: endo-1,4-beta-xylanase [Defluviitaleaceae bacterium]|nr:endo-1,4-beta-xylanase [Defluviitaleaceae bacterium]
MKKMKLVLIALVVILSAAFTPLTVSADEISVFVDGRAVDFSDAGPVVLDGRTLVPIRAVFEALGFDVEWDEAASTAIITNARYELLITVGSETFTTNGEANQLDVHAQVINERTMVPIRLPLESVGHEVIWNAGASAVEIATPPNMPEPAAASWSLSDQIPVWRAAGLVTGEEIGRTSDENPWNNFVFLGGGGDDSQSLTLTAGNALHYERTYAGFDNGLVFILPEGASIGDSVRFYFTIISQGGNSRGVFARSVGPDMGNYAMFIVPSGQQQEWTPVAGSSHVIEWVLTESCVKRPYVHLTARFQQLISMEITEITFGAATQGAAEAAAIAEVQAGAVAAIAERAVAVAEASAARAAAGARGNAWDLTLPSLAEEFNEFFWFGNIWSTHAQMNDRTTHDKYLHHYNQITASNLHKVSNVLGGQANAWNFTWTTPDYIVNWAEANDLAMVWHTLVWHTQSRRWLTNEAPGRPVTRQQAIENMHRYISTVAGRYAGRILAYDVVNESIWGVNTLSEWNANPNWRAHMRREGRGITDGDQASFWYDAFANGAVDDECGSDYIFYAFKFTRMYDPFAVLYYNDYNEQTPGKREAIAQMVESINDRWRNHELYDGRLLIEGIGMQSHQGIRGWMSDPELVRDSIIRFAQTGARVSVTELNIYLSGDGLGSTINPETVGLPQLFLEQAARYYRMFNFYLEMQEYLERVTFFIWQDLPAQQNAWRRWPYAQRPALFDMDRQAKAAFYAVLASLENHTPNISVPVITEDILRRENGRHVAMQFSATQNNHAPIHWSVAEGSLPPGMTLVSTTGVLMGTPTRGGTFTFTLSAENALGAGTRQFTITL